MVFGTLPLESEPDNKLNRCGSMGWTPLLGWQFATHETILTLHENSYMETHLSELVDLP